MSKNCPLCGREMTSFEHYPGYGELDCAHCDLVIGGDEPKTPDELMALLGQCPDYDALLLALERDHGIDASWDGLRKFWHIGLSDDAVRKRDAALRPKPGERWTAALLPDLSWLGEDWPGFIAVAHSMGGEWRKYALMNPDGLPFGLVISEDGNLLNWQGVNYVRQDAAIADAEPCRFEIDPGASDRCQGPVYSCNRCGALSYSNETSEGTFKFCPNCGRRIEVDE